MRSPSRSLAVPALATALACALAACEARSGPAAESARAAAATPPVAPDSGRSSSGRAVASDTVVVVRELDGVAGPDRLVTELRRADWQPEGAGTGDVPVRMERRLALYLGSARAPAWESGWDDLGVAKLRDTVALAGGGSLLTIDVESGDGGEVLVVLARHDRARVVLRQGGDYDGWLLRTRRADGRVLAEVAGVMVHNDSSTSPSIRCTQPLLAGWTFVFDEKTGEFVKQREVCIDSTATTTATAVRG